MKRARHFLAWFAVGYLAGRVVTALTKPVDVRVREITRDGVHWREETPFPHEEAARGRAEYP